MTWPLEDEVASAYQLLGAQLVDKDCLLEQRQIDVLVHILLPDRTTIRMAIECKDHDVNVGVKDMTDFVHLIGLLKQRGHIDKGIMVARKGFSNRAKEIAANSGVGAMTMETLRRSCENFHPYVAALISRCESSYIFKYDCYVPMRGTMETSKEIHSVEDYVSDWLTQPGTLITLLGDFGTGKTTMAQRLARRAAIQYRTQPTQSRLPILIDLRDFNKQFRMESVLRDTLIDRYRVRLRDYSDINTLNDHGRLFLILDGFDEMAVQVDESTTHRNFDEIRKLMLPNAKILLTCRTHYFKSSEQMYKVHRGSELYAAVDIRAGTQFLHLKPFTEADVEAYIRKRVSGEHSAGVLEKIRVTHNLAELATHPILLQMMAETLPKVSLDRVNAGTLYRAYVNEWLNRDDWRTQLSHQARQEVTCLIAWHLHANGKSSLPHNELPGLIRQYDVDVTSKQCEYYDHDVRTCTFLRRNARDEYEFVHRSFMEFFVAEQIILDIHDDEYLKLQTTLTPPMLRYLADLVGGVGRSSLLMALRAIPNPVARGNLAMLLSKLGEDITGALLREADFRSAHLDGLSFRDCDLTHADFRGANLRRTDLRGAVLVSANLSGSSADGARLDGANLSSAVCKRATFQGASLRDAVMSHGDMSECSFVDANMMGTKLIGCTLYKCTFTNAVLDNATLECDWNSPPVGLFSTQQVQGFKGLSNEHRTLLLSGKRR